MSFSHAITLPEGIPHQKRRWNDNCPHTESIQFNVRASSIQPLRLRRTTTPGTWFNSGIGRTPLTTTNGFSTCDRQPLQPEAQ